ncbi:MAG: hypothetical protein U0457_11855 [Candidatus Sericytochromatia bacterium]
MKNEYIGKNYLKNRNNKFKSFFSKNIDENEWSLIKKIIFRFLFCYFAIYILIPNFLYNLEFINYIGKNIFSIEETITLKFNGSGDTTFDYIQLFIIFASSFLISTIWSIFDNKNTNYVRLNYFVSVIIRFYLLRQLVDYGIIKVNHTQMELPDLFTMDTKLGDISPLKLVWVFMGYSAGYSFFTGLGEIIGGVLLISRRLVTLGSIINIAILSNVFLLNMLYGIPVKIFSFHLLFMSIFLIMNDFERCFKFFILNQDVSKKYLMKFFKKDKYNFYISIFKGILLLFIIIILFIPKNEEKIKIDLKAIYYPKDIKKSNLEKIIFDKDKALIKFFNNETDFYYNILNHDSKKGIILLEKILFTNKKEEKIQKITIFYKKLNNNFISIKGVIEKEKIDIIMYKKDLDNLKINEKFRWIIE